MSRVSFRSFDREGFAGGGHQGTRVRHGALRYDVPAGTLRYRDPWGDREATDYTWTAWLSPQVVPGFGFTSLVPSWNARTPGDSWLGVQARLSRDGVRWSPWYALGAWAETDAEIHRTSFPVQDDATTRVRTDLLEAREGVVWTGWQLRVSLLRRPGSTAAPEASLLAAVAARPPRFVRPTPGPRSGRRSDESGLRVPAYSQRRHGGESWCSPTSIAMLLGTFGLGPTAEEYARVGPAPAGRDVVHAARRVYDHAYAGTGNWSFNTAYAGCQGAVGFVTRLRSLAEAELFVAAGIPLAASVSFRDHRLEGAGYHTEGHLLVIVGFDGRGDVVCHDPASHGVPRDDQVRTVYDRAQFERVWLGGSGGIVYVVRPAGVPLPAVPDPSEPGW